MLQVISIINEQMTRFEYSRKYILTLKINKIVVHMGKVTFDDWSFLVFAKNLKLTK